MKRPSMLALCLLGTACSAAPASLERARIDPTPSAPSAGASAAPGVIAPLAPGAPPSSGTIGTLHPIGAVQVGRGGQWVTFCQARNDTDRDGTLDVMLGYHGDYYGDLLSPFMALGRGKGEPIDSVVRADPTGRWLGVVQGGHLLLIDSTTGKRLDLSALGASAHDDPSPLAAPTALSFDSRSRHVAYVTDASPHRVIVRSLATGAERSIDPGPGRLIDARFIGNWILVSVIPADTNGDGVLGRSAPITSLGGRRCRGPVASYSVFGGLPGDTVEPRVASPTDSDAHPVTDLLAVLGDKLLRRAADGALLYETPDHTEVPAVPASCAARLLAFDETTHRLVVACPDSPNSPDSAANIELHGPAIHRELPIRIAAIPDWDPKLGSDGVVIWGDHVIDLSSGTTHSFTFARQKYPESVIAVHRGRILLRREGALYVTDLDGAEETMLPGAIEMYPTIHRDGRVVFVEPLVVDLATGTLIGTAHADVFGVSASGYILSQPPRPQGVAYRLDALHPGPLSWTWPEPLAPAP